MAATPEGKVKKAVRKVLDGRGTDMWYFMPVPMRYGRKTVDFLCCYRGQFFVIEAKAPGEEPTELQEDELRNVALAGGATFVVDNVDGLEPLKFWLAVVDAELLWTL